MPTSPPGAFVWYEPYSPDVDKSKAFWTEVIGWNVDTMPMPNGAEYIILMKGEQPVAGVVEWPGGGPAWPPFIHHAKVDDAVETVKRMGGELVQEPVDYEGVGRVAIIKDNVDAIAGLITPSS